MNKLTVVLIFLASISYGQQLKVKPHQLNIEPIYIDTLNNRVGIGTSSPAHTLHINRNVTNTSRALLIGDSPLFPTANSVFDIGGTHSLNSGGGIAYITPVIQNTIADGVYNWVMRPRLDLQLNLTNFYQALNIAEIQTNGYTLTNFTNAFYRNDFIDSTGAVTNSTIVDVQSPRAVEASYIRPTNQYGFRIRNQGLSGITNSYGLYIDNQTGATNSYSAIFNGGNVGIGTTSPSTALEVAVDNSGIKVNNVNNAYMWIDRGAANRASSLNFQTNNVNKWSVGLIDSDISGADGTEFYIGQFVDGNSPNVVIETNGNVGIGTTTPNYKLDVNGTINNTVGNILARYDVARLILGVNSSTGDVHIGSSGLGNPSVGNQDYGFYAAHNAYRTLTGAWKHSRTSTVPAVRLLGSGGVSSGNEGFSFDYSANVGTADITWTNLMQILPSGNVGIGTATPTGRLEVKKASQYSPNIVFSGPAIYDGTDATSLALSNYYSVGANKQLAFHHPDSAAALSFRIVVQNNIPRVTLTSSYGDQTNLVKKDLHFNGDDLSMKSDGDIGIGTPNPGSKLDIYNGILGSTSGNKTDYLTLSHVTSTTTPNSNALKFYAIREAAGTDWTTESIRIQQRVDATDMAWIQFSGVNNLSNLSFGAGGSKRITLNASGFFGINDPTPSQALDVIGNIYYTGTITDVSDERLKINKTPLTNSLDKIMQLTPITYQQILLENGDIGDVEYGLTAQDVQNVFPDMVGVFEVKDNIEYLGLSYTQLIAPTIKAIQEQQQQIEELKTTIQSLITRIQILENQ